MSHHRTALSAATLRGRALSTRHSLAAAFDRSEAHDMWRRDAQAVGSLGVIPENLLRSRRAAQTTSTSEPTVCHRSSQVGCNYEGHERGTRLFQERLE